MTDSAAIPEQEDESNVIKRVARYKPRSTWRTWLIGRPLPSADAPHQTIGKAIGLAVFAGDALSSVAYAPEETLVILAAAGFAGFSYAFPIAVAVIGGLQRRGRVLEVRRHVQGRDHGRARRDERGRELEYERPHQTATGALRK